MIVSRGVFVPQGVVNEIAVEKCIINTVILNDKSVAKYGQDEHALRYGPGVREWSKGG